MSTEINLEGLKWEQVQIVICGKPVEGLRVLEYNDIKIPFELIDLNIMEASNHLTLNDSPIVRGGYSFCQPIEKGNVHIFIHKNNLWFQLGEFDEVDKEKFNNEVGFSIDRNMAKKILELLIENE